MHWLLIFFKNYFLIFFILLFEHWFRKENSLFFFYQKIVMNEYEMTTHKIRSILYMLTLTLLSIRVPWWTWTTTHVNPEKKPISLIAFDVIKLDNEFHYTEVWKKKWSRGKYFCDSNTTHLLWRTNNKYFSLSLLWICNIWLNQSYTIGLSYTV